MKEFMMFFRHVPNPDYSPTQEQIEAEIKKWQDWIGSIAAQGKFASTGQLSQEGKVVTSNKMVTDGPYAELKEILGGYIIVKAEDLNEATEMAKDCPILEIPGANVEIRSLMELSQ